jgi:uncharacterized lipoprotein YmbA
MNDKPRFSARISLCGSVLLAVFACVSLTGCLSFLKPASGFARYYVLTPLPAPETKVAKTNLVAVGIGGVKIPDYLLDTSIAVRRGTNQIDYLLLSVWAERLDSGLQNTLAANLATLLPTDQVRLSDWLSDDVSLEVHVAVEQFDVDTDGKAVLIAWWRVVTPGGEKTLKAGSSRFVRKGPLPDSDPSGAVSTLSELVTDLSRELSVAIGENQPTPKNRRSSQ